jgi:hypothetical protein
VVVGYDERTQRWSFSDEGMHETVPFACESAASGLEFPAAPGSDG